jgi:predicted acetyltransferase
MLHPNDSLGIPCARSQLIRYAAINQLIKEHSKQNDKVSEAQKRKSDETKSYEDLLKKIGAKKDKIDKIKRDLSKFDQKYSLFDKKDKSGMGGFTLTSFKKILV